MAGIESDFSRLPAHLPTTVKLTLGRDQNFPLFPYRIEYGRLQSAGAIPAAGDAATPVVKPMITMELFEVRRRNDFPNELFIFSPGNQNVEDQTENYLHQLRLQESHGGGGKG
jgi:hypothetical protein